MAKSAVLLRPAKITDLAGLKELIDAAYAGYHRRGIALPDVSGGLAEDMKQHHVTVAEGSGALLGVSVVAAEGSKAHLMNIAVSPDASGKGVGKALLTNVETLARHQGCDTIGLATHVDIPENVALYEHLGWSVVTVDGSKVLMTKPL